MRKYISIFNPSHEKLIEFINRYYARRGWRIISIVKGNVIFGQHWNWKRRKTMTKYADLDHSDGCPLLGVIVVNEPDSEPVIYLR